mgnify:FL=1|jgi:hypothetical protein|tara:strand:+ start:2623 stop:2901 length:279 start_codon:yes stop_codon:yes gene_type:complete
MKKFSSTYNERKSNNQSVKAVKYLKMHKIPARHSGGSVFVLTNGMTLMLDHREVKHLAICWEQEYEKTIKDFLSKFGDDKDFLSKLNSGKIK